jgi:hypothetical protein
MVDRYVIPIWPAGPKPEGLEANERCGQGSFCSIKLMPGDHISAPPSMLRS